MKEAFNIGFDLAADDPELMAGKPFRSLNAWPELSGFRKTALAYYNACAALGARLHRAFARDLGLKPDFFADKFDRPMATLRFLHYPASKAVAASTGAGEHTDYGNLTLLATDDVGGLEVRTRDGHWIEAPVVPGAFIVNIGDCLTRWTNDVYARPRIGSSIAAQESAIRSRFSTTRIPTRWSKQFRAVLAKERSHATRRSWPPII